jgi:serine phosphatase RsbU (regulator of sigma subunit)
LIGDDYTIPKTGKNSAFELKNKLKNFLTKLDSIIPEKHTLELRQSNPFHFEDIIKDDEIVVKWEIANFYNETLGNVYTTLSLFQSHVIYLEMIVLNALFVEMNSGINQSLAQQLSELTMKYEIAKSDKVIAELEKTKFQNDLRIQMKNAEISLREQTIVYFIFALIAFGILTVFIIRSNILRKEANLLLSEKNEIISLQKQEVENQKHLVEEKQKEILESIAYAKRLQEAILPPADYFSEVTSNYFILYKPKDIVAGDFYWAEKVGDLFYVAAADSTGHGVPGAMVSVVCSTALNRAVKEFGIKKTGEILDKTRELVIETFEKSKSEVKDGMDISLLCFDIQKQQITWSGANNPLWYVSNGQLSEIRADKQPIGKTDYPKPFTTHTIANNTDVVLYLFTDGLPDQFGGPNGKKYKYKQFSDLLMRNNNLTFTEQKSEIEKSFADWKGELEQVDDVCVIGISFKC